MSLSADRTLQAGQSISLFGAIKTANTFDNS